MSLSAPSYRCPLRVTIMQVNVGKNWPRVLPMVKVNNQWREVDKGFVKVNGAWSVFKQSFVATCSATLQSYQYTGNDGVARERRGAVRKDPSSNEFHYGSFSPLSIVIDGVTYSMRGFEWGTDPDATGIVQPWLSVQFFGRAPVARLAKVAKFNGHLASFALDGYDSANNIHYVNFRLGDNYAPPVGGAIPVTF